MKREISSFILTNEERKFLGLEPLPAYWEAVRIGETDYFLTVTSYERL